MLNRITALPFKTISSLTLLALLAGCSNVKIPFISSDDKADANASYKSARESVVSRSLEVPPDLTAPDSSGNYSIPGLTGVKLSGQAAKAIENNTVAPSLTGVRIEQAAGQRWLVVDAPVEKVWPQVRGFWDEAGYALTVDSAVLGIVETDWADVRARVPQSGLRGLFGRVLDQVYSSGEMEKFRTRVERSADGKSTEIYLSQRKMEEVYSDRQQTTTIWTPRPSQPEREAEMLKKLMLRMGVGEETAAAVADATSKPATTINTATANARMEQQADGKRQIVLVDTFDRAWRRVGLALDRTGYVVTDRDRAMGTFYVKAIIARGGAEEEGFWSKLAFWRDKSAGTDPKASGTQVPEYLVIVSSKENQTSVRIANKDGTPATAAPAIEVLDQVLAQLR
ncbi:outer membrane protein assembly factor BamC [Parachitinimonas caeni]|uniref:Outer membrane protein assembly factor BamC n=1 Tax=Parachitinimonas caeni TaxID=3031301 RepID=A0ABT7DWS3_9NEIS|nr:outer membrane protein assembly factor BamC [Parachitinimonas caeni]MDK2124269.1 outer membrane protein assembly factor BamC [Parachitinimonas caeni]